LKENGQAQTPYSQHYNIVGTMKTPSFIVWQSSIGCIGSAELFHFRGASSLDEGSLSLLMLDPITQTEIQSVESCHVFPILCVWSLCNVWKWKHFCGRNYMYSY